MQGRVKPAAETVTLLPVAVRIDTRLGRWYLLGMRGEMPTMVRLGSIHAVKKGKPVSEEVWEHAVQTVADTFTHTGCSGRITYGDTTEVRAELHFDSAPGMRTQFEREIRQGQIIEQDGQEYYCAYVNDPGELVPFLRSFAPWLRILPGEHDLDSRISSPSDTNARKSGEKYAVNLFHKYYNRAFLLALELLARLQGGQTISVREAFELARKKGLTEADSVIKPLLDYEIVQRADNRYYLNLNYRKLRLPMQQTEKQWLAYMLAMPEARLLLEENLY